MSTIINPHKGYLNTIFRLFIKDDKPVNYRVLLKSETEESEILNGIAVPYKPCSFHIPRPGNFNIECSDGTNIKLKVEDGYKFGGSRYKSSYIFDKCPWLFIIMHDRTYFYNRDTQESYYEAISPSTVTEVSDEYVIFRTDNLYGQNNDLEISIYSLNDHEPILNIPNITFYNESTIIWKENDDLIVYSLRQRNIALRIGTAQYLICDNELLYVIGNNVYSVNLCDDLSIKDTPKWDSEFCTFIDNKFSVYTNIKNQKTELQIVNHVTGELIKTLEIDGFIASINNFNIIDINQRRNILHGFDLLNNGIPESSISTKYHEFIFFPCEWDIYYVEKTSSFFKTSTQFETKEDTVLRSINTDLTEKWSQLHNNQTIITDRRFILFNKNESFVRSKFYSAAGYNKGHIRVYKGLVIRDFKNSIYTLSRNGYWDNKIEGDYCFKDFPSYGVIFNKETNLYISPKYNLSSKELHRLYNPLSHIVIGDATILPNGKVFYKKNALADLPYNLKAYSPNSKFAVGINHNSGKVYLVSWESNNMSEEEILVDVYDNSSFHNVILSEDGNQILYRNSEKAEIMDVQTGEVESFENLSFVKHSNGIRPLFRHVSCLQPRIVDPVTGQKIDANMMKKYDFISPNKLYYAGTIKDMYTEHFFKETGEPLSKEEYIKLVQRFSYPAEDKKDTQEWHIITSRRIKFVEENIKYIESCHKPNDCSNDNNLLIDRIIDEINIKSADEFLNLVIGLRGIAVVKRVSDNTVIAKIDLGSPLSFINYVSFSYDSRYVSIAGYRSFKSGLFLIYDLQEQKTICRLETDRAVWTTAFSSKEAVATYTSEPNTMILKDKREWKSNDDFIDKWISNRNFLTFSPDGTLIALSDQGYIPMYGKNIEDHTNWGHQPSTLVDVMKTNDRLNVLLTAHDLSDCGIEDSQRANSVASVSFSNNNKKLMMVGNDGVVVIRNLHIDDDANE